MLSDVYALHTEGSKNLAIHRAFFHQLLKFSERKNYSKTVFMNVGIEISRTTSHLDDLTKVP